MNATAEQLELGLDLAPIKKDSLPWGYGIEVAFREFHRLNPHILKNLEALAMQAYRRGRKKIGMKLLFERLRWEYSVKTNHAEGDYRLNNNFTSRYARLLMEERPELDGMFDTREIRTK